MKRHLLILAALALLAPGCANITYTRNVTTTTTDTNGLNVVTTTRHKEAARFFFEKTAAEKIGTRTTEDGQKYTHWAGATNAAVTGDVDLVNAVGTQLINGFKAGAASAVGAVK